MSVKLHVLMMAYNNDKFIRAALMPLLESDHVTSVVVVEGAWSPNTESQRSEDNTLDILHELAHQHDKLEVVYWDQTPIGMYRWYQCGWHRALLERSNKHPYYDPPAFQQQLLARDWGLRRIMDGYDVLNPTPNWMWIVDSDEVYTPEGIEDLVEFVDVVGDAYDFFTINGKNFYFNGQQYHDEWYRRLFKMKEACFFSDDNSLEIPGAHYTKTLNIDPEIVEFFHYGYVGEFRVKKKLEMWRQDSVDKWWNKYKSMMGGESYDGSSVHLFGDINPGYRDYRLSTFTGRHPESVCEMCEDCRGDGECHWCQSAAGRCGCGGTCQTCGGSGQVIDAL